MLASTFIILEGVGERTERRLWRTGIKTWDDFVNTDTPPPLIGRERKARYDRALTEARAALRGRDAAYFGARLEPRDQWRLYREFRDDAVCLDIETDGRAAGSGTVTVIGLYSHGTLTTLVQGVDLTEEACLKALAPCRLLVTYFGSGFDLPYLARAYPRLGRRLRQLPHLDLCPAGAAVGLRGGLKAVERQVGLGRPADVVGLDGWDAVRLWEAYESGDDAALERLCRYNAEDVRNLIPVADVIVARLSRAVGLPTVGVG